MQIGQIHQFEVGEKKNPNISIFAMQNLYYLLIQSKHTLDGDFLSQPSLWKSVLFIDSVSLCMPIKWTAPNQAAV